MILVQAAAIVIVQVAAIATVQVIVQAQAIAVEVLIDRVNHENS
jgi:hypothetical protein